MPNELQKQMHRLNTFSIKTYNPQSNIYMDFFNWQSKTENLDREKIIVEQKHTIKKLNIEYNMLRKKLSEKRTACGKSLQELEKLKIPMRNRKFES